MTGNVHEKQMKMATLTSDLQQMEFTLFDGRGEHSALNSQLSEARTEVKGEGVTTATTALLGTKY